MEALQTISESQLRKGRKKLEGEFMSELRKLGVRTRCQVELMIRTRTWRNVSRTRYQLT